MKLSKVEIEFIRKRPHCLIRNSWPTSEAKVRTLTEDLFKNKNKIEAFLKNSAS